MFGGEDVQITPGMQRYIDLNNAYLAKRDKYIREVVKNWKFDTIAVHGLYTVQDAIEDYQGAIIEPIFMSSSQAYRDSDEMAAALAYLIPTWCYSRIANPSTYYYEWTLALLEGYGFDGETSCCSTSSGMAAIMTAVQPFLVHKRRHVHEARNFVAVAQCYGGTFQQFSVRLMEERDIECRWVQNPENIDEWASKIDQNTRFLYGELPSNPGQSFFDIAAVADLAHSHNLPLICDSTVADAGAAAAAVPRRRHRRAVGHEIDYLQRLRRVRRADRPQEPGDQHRQRRPQEGLRAVRQIPAQPRLRPEPAPHAGHHDFE
jgi:hypothetical protein